MTDERVDRRVRRTRQLLRDALLTLVHEKGYDRVTVQDIIDRADVGRSTFYAHYRDKDDLLMSGFDEVRSAFEEGDGHGEVSPTPTTESERLPSLAFFEHADASRSVYRALVGRRGVELVKDYVHRSLSDLLRTHLRARAGERKLAIPLEATVQFAASTLLGLAIWWIESDAPQTAEEMDEIFLRLAEPGIRAALSGQP